MKLLRYGAAGEERPALLDSAGAIRSLADHIDDFSGDALGADSLQRLAQLDPSTLPEVTTNGRPADSRPTNQRLGPCVAGVGKIICIGLNYRDHAAETGAQVPTEPKIFMKATSALCGPHDDIMIPRGSEKTDWEVELAVVIGTHAKYVSEAAALDHVAGYCVMNDFSERSYQKDRVGQWTKGKSCDTFAPLGPWLVTKDEVPDPQALNLWLDVDGQRRQEGSTQTMLFPVAKLVSYLSEFMSLHPGDIISTGTPPGVGLGMDPPTFLSAGQEVRFGIEGLGEQNHHTVADEPQRS